MTCSHGSAHPGLQNFVDHRQEDVDLGQFSTFTIVVDIFFGLLIVQVTTNLNPFVCGHKLPSQYAVSVKSEGPRVR